MNFKLWLESVENDDPNIKSGMSKGEIALSKILFKFFGQYNVQYEFKGCVNKKCLRFDASFLITNRIYVVEYHGKQHYQFTPRFHKDQTIFKGQILRDKIKYNFCKEHNIPLLVIPYWEIKRMEDIVADFATSSGVFQERFANPPVLKNMIDQREKVMNDETIELNPHAAEYEELKILKQEENNKMIIKLAEFYKNNNRRYPKRFYKQPNRYRLDEEDKLFNFLKNKRQIYAENMIRRHRGTKYEGEEQFGIKQGLPNDWLKNQLKTEENNNEMIIKLAEFYKKKNNKYPQLFINQPNRYRGDEEDNLFNFLKNKRQIYAGTSKGTKYEGEEEFGKKQGLPDNWLIRRKFT